MNFTLEIKLTASPELLEAVKLIVAGLSAQQPVALTPIVAEPVASSRTRKPVADKSTAKEETGVSAEPVTDEASEEKTSKEPITVETVRAAVQSKAQTGKRDLVKSLLTKFEVSKVTDLPESKYAKFLEEVNAL